MKQLQQIYNFSRIISFWRRHLPINQPSTTAIWRRAKHQKNRVGLLQIKTKFTLYKFEIFC
jgi:hypothetical protein